MSHQQQTEYDVEDDDTNPGRGLFIGILLAMIFWIGVLAAIAIWVS